MKHPDRHKADTIINNERRRVGRAVSYLMTEGYWTERQHEMGLLTPGLKMEDGIVTVNTLQSISGIIDHVFEDETVDVYTDGSFAWPELSQCGEDTGGFGFLVKDVRGHAIMWGGGITPRPLANSGEYEFAAVQAALASLPENCRVRVHTDLSTIVRMMAEPGQRQHCLSHVVSLHRNVEFIKVKAHASSLDNNVVDEVARRFRTAHDDMRSVLKSRMDGYQARQA